MPVFTVVCVPRAIASQDGERVFELVSQDETSAWQQACRIAADGGCVWDEFGQWISVEAGHWTIAEVRTALADARIEAPPGVEAPEEEPQASAPVRHDAAITGPPPSRVARLNPAERDKAIARMYAGRRYDSYQIRASRQRRAFAR